MATPLKEGLVQLTLDDYLCVLTGAKVSQHNAPTQNVGTGTVKQGFLMEMLILIVSPYLFLLSIPAEQQEGKQGWLPLPLVCRAAHRAFGIPDCLPRASARHGAHCGRHSAAQA